MMKAKWLLGLVLVGTLAAEASDLMIQSFSSTGQLTFNTVNDGTNYNYRVEWAPTAAGPWSTFNGAGTWLDHIVAAQGGGVTSTVPMCYRVVASPGDYMVVDLSGGKDAASYPVTYYGTLADVPGGADSNAYKTTRLLMRLIPKGTFTMGSPTNQLGRYANETQHQVTLSQDFYIGVFPVTQKQWERVMGDWPSYFNNASCREARPVEFVSHNMIRGSNAGTGWPSNNAVDASSFMGRLRARTGRTFDLPTEAQWEYAARAGTTTALNSGYELSDIEKDDRVSAVGRYWYNGGSAGWNNRTGDATVATATVGTYAPNAWGLYDMHGNVWNRCLDWEAAYAGSVTDPPGANSGDFRIARGGTWGLGARYCRSAYRASFRPGDYLSDVGFRVALPQGQ